jgi:uncharacterized membrane protein
MESRAKIAGHAAHPMFIVFPLGLFTMGVVLDIVYFATGDPVFANAALWNIAGGIVGGLIAAVFGLVDWLAIPGGTRAKTIGAWHGGGNVVITVLFLVSWMIRWGTPGHLTTAPAFILGVIAVAMALITGWLGGELVDRLGVGVDRGAHLDAPSSLSGEPASSDDEYEPRRSRAA